MRMSTVTQQSNHQRKGRPFWIKVWGWKALPWEEKGLLAFWLPSILNCCKVNHYYSCFIEPATLILEWIGSDVITIMCRVFVIKHLNKVSLDETVTFYD